ncbi:DUF1853 family protein [Vibrio cholerae]|uniref:DUF1853 family protein n=1 Tax=Vibrio cholerae TaxID=666 RepID=UPI002271A83F|nr:DUF1853 family protein [Vibrio cholerae]MCX9448676.1 DUF1853 family protein [Vibrio cholerae]MCX9566003.1 DUF1853 family protein [Vibrio cholerae]MCX9569484.1 DUF1853 family protein [Vibrio cholerae]MCX9586724.1 DUF1853 family protein [Vibrio cholerae]
MSKSGGDQMELKHLMDWVIRTPALFQAKAPLVSKAPFSKTTREQWPDYQGNPRLGFLYQHLCAQLFTETPFYNAVSEEIQLINEGKTVGSLDFLAKNRKTEHYEHWEVAVKFYLLHQGCWYGPNAEDRLDIKLDHMLNHQLPLSQHPLFIEQHPLWAGASQHLLMQGRLYTNPFSDEPIPTDCLGYPLNTSQIQGYWCFQREQHLIDEPLYQLEKSDWLTGRKADSEPYTEHADGFVHCQSESGKFWFIVPNQWPQQ